MGLRMKGFLDDGVFVFVFITVHICREESSANADDVLIDACYGVTLVVR